MRKAGPITSAGWPRLQPGATRARIPGTAAPAGSDCLPRSISPHLSLLQFHGERRLAGVSNAASSRIGSFHSLKRTLHDKVGTFNDDQLPIFWGADPCDAFLGADAPTHCRTD